MSVLPAEIHTALSQLLQGLQSADNVQRSAAESELNEEWAAKRPEILLMGLTEQIQGQEDQNVCFERLVPLQLQLLTDGCQHQIRSFAAVLFRKIASRGRKDPSSSQSVDLFLTLRQEEREAIRAKLLQCLGSETQPTVRNKIGDAVAELARQHTEEGSRYLSADSWPIC